MTHGSAEIGSIGTACFAAADFLCVAYVANRFFSEVGAVGARGQSLKFPTTGEKSYNNNKGGESDYATGNTNPFSSSQLLLRWLFRHSAPSLKARCFNKRLSDEKCANKREKN